MLMTEWEALRYLKEMASKGFLYIQNKEEQEQTRIALERLKNSKELWPDFSCPVCGIDFPKYCGLKIHQKVPPHFHPIQVSTLSEDGYSRWFSKECRGGNGTYYLYRFF